jgi:hypothetical protein
MQKLYKNDNLAWNFQKNKGPRWTKRNKRTHLHNDSPIESQNNTKQSDQWRHNDGSAET